MAITTKHFTIVKICVKILLFMAVLRSYFHIDKLKQNSIETAELQTDDFTTGHLYGGVLLREEGESHVGIFSSRHLLQDGLPEPKNCTNRGINSFPTLFTNEQRLNGAVIINFLVALYMCGIIGYNCDVYFVPSLEVICEELNVQPDVAGATFMAVGSSAPEFFTALIGTFISEDDTAISAIVGSAAFNVFVIIGFCCFFAGNDVFLTGWPLLRDCLCYVTSVALLVTFIYDGEVQWWEGLIMTVGYSFYIMIMYFNTYLQQKFTGLMRSKPQHTTSDTTSLIGQNHASGNQGSYGSSTTTIREHQKESSFIDEPPNDPNMSASNQSDALDNPIAEYQEPQQRHILQVFQPPKNTVGRMLWCIGLPSTVLMFLTVPDCRVKKWRKWYFITFFMSLLWLMGASYALYWMITIIGYTFGFPDTIMGITLLAGGTSVPDLIASVIVARHGFGDMALSNVIGSNIFDILVCLGLMWFLKAAVSAPVVIVTEGLTFTSVSLMVTVAFVVLAVAVNGWKLNIKLGITCLLVYSAFITLAVIRELGLLGDISPPVYCPGPL